MTIAWWLWLSHHFTSVLLLTPLTSKQIRKDWVLVTYSHHHDTDRSISSYAEIPTSTLPAAHLMHTWLPLLPEASTYFPWIYWPILSSALISVSISWNDFTSTEKDMLTPFAKYSHYRYHKVLMTKDVYIFPGDYFS